MRVTGGSAGSGGGIANVGPGSLSITGSLIDHNAASQTGGGLRNRSGTGAADLIVLNTTVGQNTAFDGGGIAVNTSSNSTTLVATTIARNSVLNTDGGAAGVLLSQAAGAADTDGSLLAFNTVPGGPTRNCGGQGQLFEESDTNNRENGTSCLFEIPGTGVTVSAGLVNDGGDTDVFTIPASGGAKNGVAPCHTGVDQRNAARPSSACDAGAYQEGAVAPAISSDPFPEPTPVTPQPPVQTPVPTPTPTPTPAPTPVADKTVVTREVEGTVKVKVPGSNRFVDLNATQGFPVGSTIDTKKGKVEITAQTKPGAPPQKATFYDGIFKLTQKSGITTLTLVEQLAPCSKKARAAAGKKPSSRKLWGNGKGDFRTQGRYSAATIRGTIWLVSDTCAGTKTTVKQGVVKVRDDVLKKTVTLRAPKSYLARPRK